MSTLKPQQEEQLRQAFKHLNRFMLLMWRLGLGWLLNIWPQVGGRIMVITHTGRKSGRTYRTPVNYAQVEGELYCAAGFGAVADWYRNLKAHPEAEVWLPEGWWAVVAEEVAAEESDRYLELMRTTLRGSGIVAPLMGVSPQLPDAELRARTDHYRLLHLRRVAARTGPEGPGELAWIWPVATFLLLPLALRRRRRREG